MKKLSFLLLISVLICVVGIGTVSALSNEPTIISNVKDNDILEIYDEYIFEYSFYPTSLINYIGEDEFLSWIHTSEKYRIDENNNIIPRNILDCLDYFNVSKETFEYLYYTYDYYSLIYDVDTMYNGTMTEIREYFKDFESQQSEYNSRINILNNKMDFRDNISNWTDDIEVIQRYNEIPITSWTFADIIYDAGIPRDDVERIFASNESYDDITANAKHNNYDIDKIFEAVSEMEVSTSINRDTDSHTINLHENNISVIELEKQFYTKHSES